MKLIAILKNLEVRAKITNLFNRLVFAPISETLTSPRYARFARIVSLIGASRTTF